MSKDKKKYRSIFISDVHLGSKHSNADLLLDFLKSTDADNYYLVGDIIDGWLLKKKFYWPQSHNNIIQFFLKQSRRGKKIIYVAGNHDEFLREFIDTSLGDVQIVGSYIHEGPTGDKFLVIHGDQFDMITMNVKWLAMLGGWAYDSMISLNARLQWVYRHLGISGFSLSSWVKHHFKEAVNFISDYEQVVVDYAEKKEVNGVICGHIHHANIQYYEKNNGEFILYVNTGDWVESCTAIVEDYEGDLDIRRFL